MTTRMKGIREREYFSDWYGSFECYQSLKFELTKMVICIIKSLINYLTPVYKVSAISVCI